MGLELRHVNLEVVSGSGPAVVKVLGHLFVCNYPNSILIQGLCLLDTHLGASQYKRLIHVHGVPLLCNVGQLSICNLGIFRMNKC